MKIKRTAELNVKLPKVAYATIPSKEEIVNAECEIKDASLISAKSNVFYLRTPGVEDGTIKAARYSSGGCWYDEFEPDYIDEDDPFLYNFEYDPGFGTRPELVFEDSLYDAGFKPGDEFTIGGNPFTVISEKIALCDEYISAEIFDKKTTDYDKSAIKKRVDKWFNDKILSHTES